MAQGWIVTIETTGGKTYQAEVHTRTPQRALDKVNESSDGTLASAKKITLEPAEFPQVKLMERHDFTKDEG
ncbi:MAG: hypothetical protein KKD53_00840 [Proteobacteria bacterium]|nr:hypothetical protein [Pseudomonadota bacterium]